MRINHERLLNGCRPWEAWLPLILSTLKLISKKWSLGYGRGAYSVLVTSPGNCRDVIYSDEGSIPGDHVGDIKKRQNIILYSPVIYVSIYDSKTVQLTFIDLEFEQMQPCMKPGPAWLSRKADTGITLLLLLLFLPEKLTFLSGAPLQEP